MYVIYNCKKALKKLLTILFLLPLLAICQTETHTFITYDTTFSSSFGLGEAWNVRITRPTGLFGNTADSAHRPLIIMMQGQGEMGTTDTSYLSHYGPHFWIKQGWDGGVQLGNGKHYPIIVTVNPTTNNIPSPVQYYPILQYLIQHYHIKANSVYGTGLSGGSFTQAGTIEYESTIGNQQGMKLLKALLCFEGTASVSYFTSPSWPSPYPNSQWADTAYFATWATTYGGRFFYLEGNGADNFRDGWHYANAMNNVVPKSAYFSYESDGSGGHCCWNDFYNPSVTAWSTPTGGTYTAASQAGTDQMGNYQPGTNVYQWMLQQGDSSLVGSGATPPTVSAGSTQTITLPTASVTLAGSATAVSPATSVTLLWTKISGPGSTTITGNTTLTPTMSGLQQGTYVFQLQATDNNANVNTATVTITVNAATNPCRAFTWDSTNTNILITDAGLSASPRLHRCDTVYIPNPLSSAGYRSISVQSVGVQTDGDSGYIYIKGLHTTHILIAPLNSGNEFANVWGNNNWVEIDSLIMLHHRDPVMFNQYQGGYSHHMLFNGGNTTQSFFSQEVIPSLANFAGDTVNCMFDWRWTKWHFDAGIGDTAIPAGGGPFGGNTYIWLGSLAKNGIFIGAEIDHSHFLNNSSDSAPATDIHMENCFYCLIDYDTLENMGVVVHPTGHASVDFAKMSHVVIHNNVFKKNFGNTLTSRGLGDIPSMYPFFRYWANLKGDTGYDGRSAYYNNRDSFSRKYPGVETENDPTDTVYNSYYRSRVGPRVTHNTFARMQIGAGNKYYYNSAFDGYGGATDSVYFHNNSWTAAVSDTTAMCPWSDGQGGCVMMSFPNGLSLHIDSGGNSQTYTMATAGLDSNTFDPINGGVLYLAASPAKPTTTFDFLGHSRSATGSVSIGSTEYYTPGTTPPTVNAGTDQTITLPTSSTALFGTATGNGGATITGTTWSCPTRPIGASAPTIVTAGSPTTTVSGLVAGVYVFQLSATDSNSNTSTDTVQVTVNAAPTQCNCITSHIKVLFQ